MAPNGLLHFNCALVWFGGKGWGKKDFQVDNWLKKCCNMSQQTVWQTVTPKKLMVWRWKPFPNIRMQWISMTVVLRTDQHCLVIFNYNHVSGPARFQYAHVSNCSKLHGKWIIGCFPPPRKKPPAHRKKTRAYWELLSDMLAITDSWLFLRKIEWKRDLVKLKVLLILDPHIESEHQ